MSTSTVGLYLRHLALSEEVTRLSTVGDHELLAAYEAERGQAAFTELMRRHGPMVLRTCRRVLGHGPDAEDAFQATFVLLARKAGQIRRAAAGRRSVGGWLHRVAYQTAINVLTGASRRRNHERQAVAMNHAEVDPVAEATWNEIRPIIDAELDALPDEARQLLIASYLQGKTHAEMAAEFEIPLGSVAWRLEKARALLAERLVRRGVAVTGALLAVLLGEAVKGAGVPALLLVHSVEAARTFSELSLGTVSDNVARLVRCGLTNMAKSSTYWSAALVGWIGLLGAGLVACQTLKALPEQGSPSAAPPAPSAAERPAPPDTPLRKDHLGDPLPPGALARLGTLRLRQTTGVHSLGFTAEGKSLLTAGQGESAYVWDVSSGRLLRPFGGRGDNALLAAALSPDGRILAGRAVNGDLCLWDADAGTLLHRLKGQRLATGAKIPLAFSPDGKTLIWKDGNTLRLWQTATGQAVWTLEQTPAALAAYTADGKALIWSGGYRGDLHLCDVATGKELRHWDDTKRSLSVLICSPDGRVFLVYASRGPVAGDARLLDLAADKEVWRLENEEATLTAAAFSPDGKIIATAHNGGPIQLRDAATGKELRRCAGSGSTQCLMFSPDGKTLASGSGTTFGNSTDQMVHLWNVATGREIHHAFDGHRAAACSATFTTDGKDVFSSGWEGSLRLWDAATGEQRRRIALAGDEVKESGTSAVTRSGIAVTPFAGNSLTSTANAVSRDGKTLVSASWDRREGKAHIKVRRWERESGREVQGWSRELEKGPPSLMVLSADAERLACMTVGGLPGQVYVWETAKGKELSRIAGSYPAFSGDGRLLATAPLGGRTGEAGSFSIWDAATAKELCSTKVPEGRVFRILFSPDGRSLATMSYGNARPTVAAAISMTISSLIHVWPLLRDESQKGGLRLGSPRLLPGGVPPRWAGAWAFSPDGRTLAVAGEGGNVRLLETAAGKERGRFTGHAGDVLALSFAPDGRRVASGSRDTTLLVWDVTGRLRDGSLRPVQLSATALEGCWSDLASEDAARAARAIWTLAAAPSQAVPYLVEHLRTSTKEFKDRASLVPQLIRDLDDDAFTVRDKSKTQLARLGEAAEPALRQALAKASSLEMRRSLEQLLKEVEARRQAPSGESLRSVRVLEVLEQIGTRDAREALKALTAGAPSEASLTREIHAALDRLNRAERQ